MERSYIYMYNGVPAHFVSLSILSYTLAYVYAQLANSLSEWPRIIKDTALFSINQLSKLDEYL